MKKLIAAGSICLSIVFAVALANAEDTSATNPSTDTTTSSSDQQPGASGGSENAGAMSGQNVGQGAETGTISSETTHQTQVRTTKTCTDQNGVTYRKGESGYNKCMQMLKRHREQMSGATGSSSSGMSGGSSGMGSSSSDTGSSGG